MDINAVSSIDTKTIDVRASKPQVQSSSQTTQQVQAHNTQQAQKTKVETGKSNSDTSNSKQQNNGTGYNKQLDESLTEINKKFNIVNREVSYELHDATNRFVVKVKDSDTGDVIKEIPSKETLDFVANMLDLAGLSVDEKG